MSWNIAGVPLNRFPHQGAEQLWYGPIRYITKETMETVIDIKYETSTLPHKWCTDCVVHNNLINGPHHTWQVSALYGDGGTLAKLGWMEYKWFWKPETTINLLHAIPIVLMSNFAKLVSQHPLLPFPASWSCWYAFPAILQWSEKINNVLDKEGNLVYIEWQCNPIFSELQN